MPRSITTPLVALALLACCGVARAADDVETLGALAFRTTFPLVGMAGWRDSYIKAGGEMNHFAHRRDLVNASAQEAYQNTDALYSNAWVDLGGGPVSLNVPATGTRYMALQFVSAWTDTFSVLTRRELGGRATTLFLTPPGWSGTVPTGARRVSCPTTLVALWLRLFSAGEADLRTVRALQDQFTFSPEAPNPAPVATDFLTALGSLIAANPVPEALRASFERLAPLGLTARGYNTAQLKAADLELVKAAIERSRRALNPPTRQPRRLESGWAVYDAGEATPPTMDERIFRAQGGPGAFAALPRRENVYALGYADINGEALRGDRRYKITFDASSTPPVDGFWSISVYTAKGALIGTARHSLHSQSAGLRREANGTLNVLLAAAEVPLAEQGNWLPLDREQGLRVVLRLYQPRAGVFDGHWHPPLIVPAD